MKKGIDKERDLVNYLDFKGFTAVRIAGSGAGTKKARPDIIASNKVNVYAIELKSSSNNVINIKQRQVKELIRFSKDFGAIPKIAIKFNYEPYYFLSVNDLTPTKYGNYKIKKSDIYKFDKKRFLTYDC